MIAAIYARKSTEQTGSADEQKSVARQVEHARAYAARKGWTVAEEHIYVDDGISGAEFANRPGFLRLMNVVRPHPPFQILIMSEESRLGRETIEVSYALKQLVQAGVRVWLYLEDRQRTLDGPIEKAMLSLQAMADEMEREKARQRTYDALLRKARAGHVTGGRTFGYDNVRLDAGHVERRVNDAEAAVVRRIFELVQAGRGITTIAKLLNEERARSPRPQQGRPAGWAPSSVRAVLHRSLYRGEIIWNQTRKRDEWGAENRRARPQDEWIRIPVPDLAIVPPSIWEAAHAQMDRQRERYSRASAHGAPPWSIEARYLLTGLLRCACCGGGLEARSRSHGRERAVFYGCSAFHRRGRSVCDNRLTVPMATADEAILTALESNLLHPRVLETAVHRVTERLCRERRGDPREATARELAAVDRELSNLTAAVAAGGNVPALVAAIRAREAQRRALLDRLVQPSEPVELDSRAVMADLRARLEDWRELLREETPHARGLLKQLIVGRVLMEPDRERACYRFRGTGTLLPLVEGIMPVIVSTERGVPNGN